MSSIDTLLKENVLLAYRRLLEIIGSQLLGWNHYDFTTCKIFDLIRVHKTTLWNTMTMQQHSGIQGTLADEWTLVTFAGIIYLDNVTSRILRNF